MIKFSTILFLVNTWICSFPCFSQFVGGDGSGAFATILTGSPCDYYKGNTSSGAASILLNNANCTFFFGGDYSGQNQTNYINPILCPQYLESINGGSGHDARAYTEDNPACAIIALSVETSPLFGQVYNEQAVLSWVTFSEFNNSGFEIQKSFNGIDWEILSWIDGQGTSTSEHSYSYTDPTFRLGEVNYYRYKQIDFDGVFYYSNSLALSENESDNNVIAVYPNPSTNGGLIKIRAYNNLQDSFVFTVFSVTGNLVMEDEIDFSPQEPLYYVKSTLPDGVYFFRLISQKSERVYNFKIQIEK